MTESVSALSTTAAWLALIYTPYHLPQVFTRARSNTGHVTRHILWYYLKACQTTTDQKKQRKEEEKEEERKEKESGECFVWYYVVNGSSQKGV